MKLHTGKCRACHQIKDDCAKVNLGAPRKGAKCEYGLLCKTCHEFYNRLPKHAAKDHYRPHNPKGFNL